MLMTQKELEIIMALIKEEVTKELDRREHTPKTPRTRPAKKAKADE